MLLTLFLLLALAAAIYLSCEFFVNGIEWLGRHWNVGATVIGSVLAAFGTALPESAVTFVAVVFGDSDASKDIGVGAALGGPLVLATIAYAVVGLVLLLRARTSASGAAINANLSRLRIEQQWFLWIFVCKVALGFLFFPGKAWFAWAFVAAYGFYVWRHFRDDAGHDAEIELEPLKLRPRDPVPNLAWCAAQTLAALGVIGIASHYFVGQLQAMGTHLHLAPHVVALLLSPIATELPETMNAIIWVRQGKERLAFANISGAMMIQATIPSALGIGFTPWRFDATLALSALATIAAIVWLWWTFRSGRASAGRLLVAAAAYGVFAVLLPWAPGLAAP